MKLTIYRDNTPTLHCQIKKLVNGVWAPPNLTGATITWAPKANQSLPNTGAQFVKTTGGGGITITDGPNAKFDIGPLSTLDTQALPSELTLLMDLLVTDQAGNTFTVANYNELEIKPNFSRK